MAKHQVLSLENFPLLRDSGRRTAEEADLLQRSKKKIKANVADGAGEEGKVRSFRDTLKGADVQRDATNRDEAMEEDELEFGLMKCHISILKHQRGKFEIPEFVLSKRALQKIRKPFKLSLIVKLLGKRLGLNRMEQRIQKMWARSGVVSVVDLSNDFFVVNFSTMDDYELALLGGPWMISDSYLTVRDWKPNFDPKTEAIEDVLIWIRFPDLPLEYYDESILEAMGNEIGRTVKVDMTTSLQSRGGYARVGVQVDLRKPLLPLYIIGNKERPITYEGLHLLCFCCGMYGHTERECKERKGAEDGGCGKEKGADGQVSALYLVNGLKCSIEGDHEGSHKVRKGAMLLMEGMS
ncbi:uncharacterized protein LOC114711371 [Neltuma alba]|uniref:uncharacterized protein LOC114711371 n=1 Tax=Neltuma alba TaxID=207710 RepID=UPI0010A4B762|nr:uncharacterized protein LOC114711371 [Prosopis alba]